MTDHEDRENRKDVVDEGGGDSARRTVSWGDIIFLCTHKESQGKTILAEFNTQTEEGQKSCVEILRTKES